MILGFAVQKDMLRICFLTIKTKGNCTITSNSTYIFNEIENKTDDQIELMVMDSIKKDELDIEDIYKLQEYFKKGLGRY